MGILRSDIVSHSQLEPTGSVTFDGTGDNLSLSLASGGLSGDFTLEYFVYQNTLSDYQTHFAVTRGATGFNVGTDSNGVLTLYDQVSSAARKIEVSGAIEINRWYHWAFVRSGSTITGYLDGEAIGLPYSQSVNYSGTTCTIGSLENNSEYMNGFISNLRLVKGAIYKNNFTPPKFELKNVPGTLLLCCQSSSSATTASVKPGTITANGNAAASAFIPDLKKDNTDTGVVFEDNTKFDTLSYMVPPAGRTDQSNRGRGLIIAGYTNPLNIKTTDYVQIQSLGNAIKFGDATALVRGQDAAGSSTRAVSAGGYVAPGIVDTIEYFTTATTSNAVDFGNLVSATSSLAGFGNETRGIWAGGYVPSASDKIDYVTIATTGNASDFGNCVANVATAAGCASPTRGVFGGGYASPAGNNTLQYVTIATTGNATDFGDLTAVTWGLHALSSNTRGVFGGGVAPSITNTISYVTIATTGNAADFGDLIQTASYHACTSNGSRGIFAGGDPTSTFLNTIQYVTISTTGNSSDFGDMTTIGAYRAATSDSHGGLS